MVRVSVRVRVREALSYGAVNNGQGRIPIYVVAGALASRFTCCPQIQKLADHSDVISEVPKCSKILLGSLQHSLDLLADGEGARCPLPKTPSLLSAFGPRFYGSQGPTQYRVGNPTNDRFRM